MANKKDVLVVAKQLQQIAKRMNVNLTKVVEDKLLETYKTNVALSYGPRSEGGEYVNTGTFMDSIYVEKEDDTISVMIRNVEYDTGEVTSNKPKSTVDVHTFLTEGTVGGGEYPYQAPDGKIKYARNYPTPVHQFEDHTIAQMRGFLDGLENDIQKGKYTK